MNALVGRINEIFTDAEADVIGKGRVIQIDHSTGPKLFKLVKLKTGASDLAHKRVAVIDDMDGNTVDHLGTLNHKAFAGVRSGVKGATPTTLTADNWAFLQILGNATVIFGDSALATIANGPVVLDDDTDKGKVGGGVVDVTSTVNETTVEAVTNALMAYFALAQGAVSTTDADVEINIVRNAWGQYCPTAS